ncbi:selenocysteine-specific elongation factor [Caminicella sporogenes DSM 14501]|uniref:Selenocysteine-specific elongation factor n=1 Tax=Caminicella sporogenes DSM 14501 TaxID=1121266 RepID=A0A1M6LU76_9FIRM|nr:selenocysteine-specific translation elongation factor [Caminicella sporogenes]RKD27952.1 selenocysteine-specific translation elongation factor [Caminicella sporogenes]SHJ74719.1 selenocysteine-specific elongation factor [Caminicella sporogenes DSM 14501]
MKNIIIGTAGHIDHGKTTLIKALTGIETDRLKEEKKRGITIDLGFAFFKLPNGRRAGIVDVPGHERFIKNMLAGASGIDLVLFVIAADEGVMPQTQEHLDILSYLDVKKGIIVLTKCDLVDEEWIKLVAEDIKERVKGTFLEDAPIVEVSSINGKGLDKLKSIIMEMTEEVEEKKCNVPCRLPIDRIFTLSGFGTVVTGTLIEGVIEEKQIVHIYPKGLEAKVRSIQVHGESVNKAYAGQRVAVNLTGIKKEDIDRGDVLAAPNSMKSSMIIDVKLNLLKTSNRKVENWNRLRLYHGTKEVLCRVVLLDRDELYPGESCFAQLRLEEEISSKYGDKFVVRYYSPLETIGGGVILDPNPPKHKRFREEIISELESKSKGNKENIIEKIILKFSDKYPDIDFISIQSGISKNEIENIIDKLVKDELVIKFSENTFVHRDYINNLEEKLIKLLNDYHSKNPLKPGLSKEEVRSRLFSNIKGKLFDEIINYYSNLGTVKVVNKYISLKEFNIELSESQKALKDKILKIYLENKFKTPTIDEIFKMLNIQGKDRDIIDLLINMGFLIKISDNIILHVDNYNYAKNTLKEFLVKNKEITLGQFRDLLNTSRKYAIPLLEYFDYIKFTKRVEDKRMLQ